MCLVTGGARGLGNEFCKAFVQSGCTDLAILDLKEDEAEAAAEELVKQSCRQFSFSSTSLYFQPFDLASLFDVPFSPVRIFFLSRRLESREWLL